MKQSLRKVVIIGAGPETIGQGPELNGALRQACDTLRAEDVEIIVHESNLAARITDPGVADRTYVEPLTLANLERVIEKERPDAILSAFGGRTAANLLVGLAERGILQQYGLKTLGATPEQIIRADELFSVREALGDTGMKILDGAIAANRKEAIDLSLKVGFPLLVRPLASFAGAGGTIVYNREEFGEHSERAFEQSTVKKIMVLESLEGWSEYELILLRDSDGHCLTLTGIEYLEPVGIHAGDSMKVIPPVGLTMDEWHFLNEVGRKIMDLLEIKGGAGVRFAQNPINHEWALESVTPRFTLYTALTAQACGLQLARIWTQLVMGYSLKELMGDAREALLAPDSKVSCVALPRFAFENFPNVNERLDLTMKSIGQSLAFGGNFKEALQKAERTLGRDGFPSKTDHELPSCDIIKERLLNPGPHWLTFLISAFKNRMSVTEIAKLFPLAPWFLREVAELSECEKELGTYAYYNIPPAVLRKAKCWGFSDRKLAYLLAVPEARIRETRRQWEITPEFHWITPPQTELSSRICFFSYNETLPHPTESSETVKVLVVGGCQCAGAGTEVSYGAARAVATIKASGLDAILIDPNPAALATHGCGYERVYMEPLAEEDLLNVVAHEQPKGVIWEFAGKITPEQCEWLEKTGVVTYGVSAEALRLLENSRRFGEILEKCGMKRTTPEHLRGDALGVVVEAIGDGTDAVITAVVEQIEEARINWEDSAGSLPPHSLNPAMEQRLRDYTLRIVRETKTRGLLNLRYAVRRDMVEFLEINRGAGQITVFITKATGIPSIETATKAMLGIALQPENWVRELRQDHTAVKETVFPFNRFPEVDPILGTLVRSTGAVIGLAPGFGMAFIKAQLAAGENIPVSGKVYLSIGQEILRTFVPLAKHLQECGFELLAREEIAGFFEENNLHCRVVKEVGEGRPDIVDWIKNGKVDWIISTPAQNGVRRGEMAVRSAAVERGIPITTTFSGALAAVEGMRQFSAVGQGIKALQDYSGYGIEPVTPKKDERTEL